MKRKYTSLFNITADKKLSIIKKVIWIFANFFNNLFPNSNVDNNLIIKEYRYKKNNFIKNNIDNNSSPARILCDNFWLFFPWIKVLNLKNNKINFLEIGCGKGVYANLLKKIIKENLSSYIGVDISNNSNWDNFDSTKFKFYKDNSDNVLDYINDVDVLFTQSAIEHFENDLFFFRQISKYLNSNNKNILQIHLFPSTECLSTYLWHGYRQYSPRTISKISNLFDENYNKILLKLGSSKSNSIHKKFITYPKFFLKKDLRIYKNENYMLEFNNSLERSDNFQVSFYALIISSKKGFNINLSDF